MIKKFNKIKYIYLVIKIFLLFFLLFSPKINAKSKEMIRLMDLFENVFEKTHEEYVEEISEQELMEKAISGMLSALDPHSGYMNEETFKEMQVDTSGKFGGLGIQITMEEGFVKIISPIDDTPAYKAGLKAGDLITQINNKPVMGLNLKEAVDMMRGRPGTKIIITIAREGLDLFDVELKREIIKIESVKNEIFDDIGYIRISQFTEQTNKGLIKAVKETKITLDNEELGYILDLRSNPGGLLSQAVAVSDLFLNEGVIVSTKGRDINNDKKYSAKNGDIIKNKPLVILINGGSASASEIVAGALQDHKRAIVIGTKSFGKGSVQSIIPLWDFRRNNQGAMKLTTSRYYTPLGKSIQAKGIEPDIYVEQGEFKSNEISLYSESDFFGSLDSSENLEIEEEIDENQKIFETDYQLSRAIDLVKALSILDQKEG
ncbi:MAG: Carboxy-terminal processing protease CtpB [Alphaproteobacteria bacterium MarineAlpha5_Bin12]|nr:MAG: Carboxy-terminal processing protease CtpB [Alphaproteobacteria bacterium MarineAlpha5_Bin12]